MRRADRIGAVLLLAFGLWFSAVALLRYRYWSPSGPGSGFFPFWLGVAVAALAVILLAQTIRRGDPGASWLPRGHGAVRLAVVVAATALFIAVLPVVGMTLGTALFLVALLKGVEGHTWATTLGVAVATPAVNWAVFIRWLGVPFPPGVLGF